MSGVPILHINQRAKFLSFRVEGILATVDEPIWPQYSQPISDSLMQELQQHASQVLRSAPRSGLGVEVAELGLFLYDNLVPEGIRSLLRTHSGSLYIWTELSTIPWEYLHDGEQFWGMKYPMGRRIISSISDQPRVSRTVNKAPSVLIIAANPNNDLVWLDEEVETVMSSVGHLAEVTVLSGTRATMIDTLRELRKGCYSIVHYCGHAVSETASGEGALLLHDGRLLTASTITGNLRGAPTVFLNACQSARGTPESELTQAWDGVTSTLSDAFLHGGAAGVIGSVADVGDKEGAQFAGTFYRHLIQGITLGEAIQSTRKLFCEELPDNPVWSSFVLFGNPSALLGVATAAPSPMATPSLPDVVANEAVEYRHEISSPSPRFIEPSSGDVWQEVLAQVKPAVLYIETDRGGGTGFLVGNGGFVVTCNHLVRNTKSIRVKYIDGRTVTAEVLGADSSSDLVILRLAEVLVIDSLHIADPASIQEGQSILAVGHPFGFSFTASRGIVSSRCRVIDATAYVQTDAALNPGNSGGPMISESGEVVGVVSFGVGGGAQGLGFGIAPSHLRALITRLRIGSATHQ